MSSLDKMLQELIADEVNRAVAPLMAAIEQLQSQGELTTRLAAALGQPLRRGPGRPPKLFQGLKLKKGRPGRRGRPAGEHRGCAVQSCRRPARSKGYCSAHYQKLRMLTRTNRLPSDWKEYAATGSVKDVVLPRGRAGAKALAEARKK